MKFLVYLLTFRWLLDGYRKVRYSNDALEILKFEEASPIIVRIKLPYAVSRKKMIKALKILRDDLKSNPLDLNLGLGKWSLATSEDIVDHMIESRGGCSIIFPKKQVPNELSSGLGWYDFGIFKGATESYFSDIPGLDGLLLEAWFKVKQRKGEASSHCDRCEQELTLTSDITCGHCSCDIELPSGLPSKSIKIYEEILAYETSTGKEILSRCG